MNFAASRLNRRYGKLPDVVDRRDYTLDSAPVYRTPRLPSSVDLTRWCGPVKDQGALGACTAFSWTLVREFLARRYQNQTPVFSPLYLYYKERELEGTIGYDAGAQSRTGAQALTKFGCCLESEDPYKVGNFLQAPTSEQEQAAAHYKGGAYHRINTTVDALSCLASGYPFSFGMAVYQSFESDELASTGLMAVPNKDKELVLGGHEMTAVGYDLAKAMPDGSHGAFLVQNSWGTDWGQKGLFWMPKAVVDDADLVQDMFILHLGLPWIPKH